jgi:hypothetical protein
MKQNNKSPTIKQMSDSLIQEGINPQIHEPFGITEDKRKRKK